MPKDRVFPEIEPCPDCPVPPRFIFSVIPNEKGFIDRCGIECRECGEKWTEPINEEL